MGLRRREMHEDPTAFSYRDIINRGLPTSGFTVEQTGNSFHISYISTATWLFHLDEIVDIVQWQN